MKTLRIQCLAAIITICCFYFTPYAQGTTYPATLGVTYGPLVSISVIDNNNKQNSLATTEFQIAITSTPLGLEDFPSYGYCIELAQTVGQGAQKNYLLSDFTDPKYYEAAWVMENYAAKRPGVWSEELKKQAAAVQGLIWELTGNIKGVVTTPDTADVFNKYKSIKDELGSVVWNANLKSYLNNNYMLAAHSTKQDLIIKVDPVPEPATLLLFGSGMLGLAGLRFRRRAKAN